MQRSSSSCPTKVLTKARTSTVCCAPRKWRRTSRTADWTPAFAGVQRHQMAKLYFYYAAMNAGKSTTLLQADFNDRERGMETMLWTARLGDRAGAGVIGSRMGLSATALSYDESADLFEESMEYA